MRALSLVPFLCVAATSCGGVPQPMTPSELTPRPPGPAAGCRGRSLEYTVGRTVLQPVRIVRLSCEAGRPRAVFFTATPPVHDEEGVETEVEAAGPEEVALDRERWLETWAALERAGVLTVGECEGRGNDESGVAHRLEVSNGAQEMLRWCHGREVPREWRRVVEVLERLENELFPETGEEFVWPFDSDYWQGELSYYSR